MVPDGDTQELETIAAALRTISKETGYTGLAKALLDVALAHSKADRGAVLLSESGELLAKADANFPREKAKIFVSHPAADELCLPPDLSERVLTRQETVVAQIGGTESALIGATERPARQDISVLYLPLVFQDRTIGVLYLESTQQQTVFTPRCLSVMAILASQAAVSFESAQLFDALRETNMWMVKGQQIGRMGSYRWNTRTLLSRGSREVYRIIGIDLNVNPVPFQAFRDRVHPDDLPALEKSLGEAVGARAPFSHEYRVVHEDGTIVYVEAVGQFDLGPTGDVELEGIITDITERKAAEQARVDAQTELARATRLASLGEFAGSIVHEVNQPITGIIASAEASLRWLGRAPIDLDEARTSLTRVIELARRASNVVSGLRSLVREGQLQFADVHINEAVEEVLFLLNRELQRGAIALRTDFDTSMPAIEADRVQLQQVVLNLVRNAVDAMSQVKGRPRVLTISSKLVGDHAHMSVADTGPGIDPSVAERLFDPLSTTKDGGLGLGLSICRKIIDAHGGELWVRHNSNLGAIFTFAVPRYQSSHRARSA